MKLKLEQLDELKASFLYEELKDSIDWSKVRKMNGLYKKALKYLNESSYEIYYEYDKRNYLETYQFIWKPIRGYNKRFRVVTLTLDVSEENLKHFSCNCDGYKKNGICSHILATYIVLKRRNMQLHKEIEDMVRDLMKIVREVRERR